MRRLIRLLMVVAFALVAALRVGAEPAAQVKTSAEAPPPKVVLDVASEIQPADTDAQVAVPTPSAVIAGVALLGIVLSRRRRVA